MCPHHTPSILLDRTPELFLSQSVAVQVPFATAAYADRRNTAVSFPRKRESSQGFLLSLES